MKEPRLMRPVMYWNDPDTVFPFHPACEEYESANQDINEMAKDMKANGYAQQFPICLLNDQIVAGKGRYLAAKKAEVEFLTTSLPSDTDPYKFAERENERRRQLTKEWIEQKRQERIEKVAGLRQEGKSTREIAEVVGVSSPTVRDDLEKATGRGLSVETPDGKVTGKDGRKQPATKPKIYCSHCQTLIRKGQEATKGCEECKEARKPKKKTLHEQIAEDNGKEEDDTPETAEDKIKAHNSAIESFCRQLMKFVEDTCPDDPWLKFEGRKEGAIRKFREGCETLRTCKCSAECPECKGEGCKLCLKTGRVPKFKLDQMK